MWRSPAMPARAHARGCRFPLQRRSDLELLDGGRGLASSRPAFILSYGRLRQARLRRIQTGRTSFQARRFLLGNRLGAAPRDILSARKGVIVFASLTSPGGVAEHPIQRGVDLIGRRQRLEAW